MTVGLLRRGARYVCVRDGQPCCVDGGERIEAGVISEGRVVRKA